MMISNVLLLVRAMPAVRSRSLVSSRLSPSAIAKATAGIASLTAQWTASEGADGYQVQVAADTSFAKNKKTVTVTGGMVRKKISGLTSGTTYYVRVRAFVTIDETKAYGSWSAAKAVTVK